jgi:hypothetical protein
VKAPANYPAFLVGLMASLGWSVILSERSYSPEQLGWILCFYGAGLALKKWFFDTRHFAQGQGASEGGTEAREQIIFAGKGLETEAEAEREKRALEGVLRLPLQMQLRLGVGLMVAGYAVLASKHMITVHLAVILHVFSAVLLLPVMTINHFILPLIVNTGAVALTYFSESKPDPRMYAIHALLLIYTLLAYQNVERESRQTRPDAHFLPRIHGRLLLRTVQLGILYLLILGFTDFLVPVTGQARSERTAAVHAKMTELQKALRDGVENATETRAEPDPGARPEEAPSGVPGELVDKKGAAPALDLSKVDLSKLVIPSVLPSLKPEEAAQAFSKENVRKAQALLKQLSEQAKGGVILPSSLPKGGASPPALIFPSATPIDPEAMRQVLAKAAEAMRGSLTPVSAGSSGATASAVPISGALAPPKPKEEPSDWLEWLLTPAALVLVAAAIYWFRRKMAKQADPKKLARRQLGEEQKHEIANALKLLAGRKLPARQEVIARYDLFLRMMEMAHTARETYLPPTDFHRRVRLLHPPIEPHSRSITDSFCDVYYGDQSVSPERLKGMRTALQQIFTHFTA